MKQLRITSCELRAKSTKETTLLLLYLFVASYLLLVTDVFAEDIGARAAVVIDSASEKILYAKNPNWKLPPASTTKLITAMVVLDRISPESVITISDAAAETPSVSPLLRAGEKYTVRDVLYLALMRSVNSAAVALAEAVAGSENRFASMMNEKAALIGAENTLFINASGLPGPGQHITAFDLAKIMKEALKYPLIREIISTRTKDISSDNGRRIIIKNTNQLLWSGDDLLGGKTGYTRAAGHCFVCAAKKGQNTLITAVLGEHVRNNIWDDSSWLLERGQDVIAQKSEPLIYFSAASETPVVLASYNPKDKKKHKSAKYKKNKRLKSKDKTRTAEKGYKKKSNHVRIAKKGKKSAGKSLS